jgi:hypothetical protein
VSVKQIESALTALSLDEKQAVRYFLDDLLEAQLEVDGKFKSKIERAKRKLPGECIRVFANLNRTGERGPANLFARLRLCIF